MISHAPQPVAHRPALSRPARRRGLVFVFSGHGSQWPGMGRQLMREEAVFRAAIERCGEAIRLFAGWSLPDVLYGPRADAALTRIDVVQPALFAVQVALAALWRSWSVEPDAVIGHSVGEVAAAHVAGALCLEDAARIVCTRSRLLQSASGKGAMAVVAAAEEEARRALRGHEASVHIAAHNSPSSTVLAGDPAALREITEGLQRQQVVCRWVKVDVASHSPQMDPLLGELARALRGVRPRVAAIPIYSTVTGEARPGERFGGPYWTRNLREPVRFSDAVQRLIDEGHEIFLEISPHPILLPAIGEGLLHRRAAGAPLASLRRCKDERRSLLISLDALRDAGRPPGGLTSHGGEG